ncbi:MAG TPA: ATP-dependent DNA helicase RecG [Candidatus Saccharimonadales bacterium]|nr:ATP-dependent DNA helicase RecG [Candidatus Saccharimonadales bacterium]
MLNSPVGDLPGVGPKIAESLKNLGVQTVEDLLFYLPSRLEDWSNVQKIQSLRAGEEAVIQAEIKKVSSRKSRAGRLIIQAKVADESGEINALWFGQRYLLGLLKPGEEYFLYGQKRLSAPLGHPFFVKKIITKPEVAPIYRSSAGLTQAAWRKLFANCRYVFKHIPEPLPAEIIKAEKLPALARCLEAAHFPTALNDVSPAQQRLGFDELLLLALAITAQKAERQKLKASAVPVDRPFLKEFSEALGFQLTDGQRRAAWEIIQDLNQPQPMRRLLYGEVGSGKTAVAAIAIASVLKAGQRAIILAPTTALAAQHLATFQQFLAPSGFTVALLTGEQKAGFATADLVVATHAAFYQMGKFSNVGLIIIDEQHRFGVEERQKLLTDIPQRHILMMTATPIPRSLAQTIFGSLDITYLRGKPAHQQKITTTIFLPEERAITEKAIERRLANNESGYVICPLIEEVDEATDLFSLERKAVTSEAKRLKERFPLARIGVLNGRLKEADKQKIITKFRQGEVDILVSTTVVEVGIDNPNASWILIEDADRFGLSQLHQLRGRVGRGSRASVCFLADSGSGEIGQARLQALVETDDGLELAEADLRLRGPGELTGLSQSGLPALRYADWADAERIRRIFTIAERLTNAGLANNPNLEKALNKYGQAAQEKTGRSTESQNLAV